MRILYDSKKTEYKNPFGALKTDEKCCVSIKIPKTCKTERSLIRMENDNTGDVYEIPMEAQKTDDENYDVFMGEFSVGVSGLYYYHFLIFTLESDFELFRFGYSDTNIGVGEKWQLTVYPSEFSVPRDFCGKVMYQIFPDRFYRDSVLEAKGKLEPYYIHSNTDDIPDYLPDENGEVKNCDFFGGNLRGIISKLDYVKSLGVSIIYLNPIFMAYSNHRYDTCDYKRIDPLLGDESDFVMLCEQAHKRNIKIILDGVFSHTGSNSVYFDKNKIFGNGAYHNVESPYRNWYAFGNTDDEYGAWWGIETLPCVNELDGDYLDFIIRDSDSVIAHWLNLGADGYRLDVADELPDEFIKLLRNRVKEIKPDSFVVGEVWEDASNKISYGVRRKYFSDAELDSVMNYVYKNAIIDLCTGSINCEEFKNEIMTIAENYPPCALHSLMNSLSTHDTPRILNSLSGKAEALSKDEAAVFTFDETTAYESKMKLYVAMLLQYTLPGTACIYYGDEIGMKGFGDPFCRGYFKWDDADVAIVDFCKELGKLKNNLVSLQMGNIEFTNFSDGILSFERSCGSETVGVTLNLGNRELSVKDTDFLMLHNADKRNGRIYVKKNGFCVYLKSKI